MSWSLQINPTSEAYSVDWDLVWLLEPFMEDFEMRYASLQAHPALIAALKHANPKGADERDAISQLIAELEKLGEDEAVEVLLGH